MYSVTVQDVIHWESCKTPDEIRNIFGDREEMSPVDVIASSKLETWDKVYALCHENFWRPQEQDAIKLALIDFVFDIVPLPGAIKSLRWMLKSIDNPDVSGQELEDAILAAEAEREYMANPLQMAIADIFLHSVDFECGFFITMTRILSNITLVNFFSGRRLEPLNAFLQVATSNRFCDLDQFSSERNRQ